MTIYYHPGLNLLGFKVGENFVRVYFNDARTYMVLTDSWDEIGEL